MLPGLPGLPSLPVAALPPGLAAGGMPTPADAGSTAVGEQAFAKVLGRLREHMPLHTAPVVKPDTGDPKVEAADPLATDAPLATTEDENTLPADVLAAMLAAPSPSPAPAFAPATAQPVELPAAPAGLPAEMLAASVAAVSPPTPAAVAQTDVAGDAAPVGATTTTTTGATSSPTATATTATPRSAVFERRDAPGAPGAPTLATPALPAEPGLAPAVPAVPQPVREAAHTVRDATRAALAPPSPQLPAQAVALGGRSAELRTAAQDPAPRSATAGVPDAAGAFAAMLSATPGLQGAAPTTAAPAVQITAHIDTPEFAELLGVHLSTLTRDGVQRAELHLNPTEMGPVSVQIALDGTQARIEFGAEVAATRQAIEHSLPALASALRDAGLTLAGGAVSQHTAGQGGRQGASSEGQGREGGRSRGDGGDAPLGRTMAATAARRLVRAGGVDLYA